MTNETATDQLEVLKQMVFSRLQFFERAKLRILETATLVQNRIKEQEALAEETLKAISNMKQDYKKTGCHYHSTRLASNFVKNQQQHCANSKAATAGSGASFGSGSLKENTRKMT
ncbi:unnamed protein product, partial [Amoebophrya sp. A120]|eukprot:GSA120T00008190001.1